MKTQQLLITPQETLPGELRKAFQASDFKIASTIKNLGSALYLVAESRPEVLLIDLDLPGILGISISQQVKILFPAVKVVLLLPPDNLDRIYASLISGADAYCLKDISAAQLIQVIKAVKKGEIVLHPGFIQRIIGLLREYIPSESKGSSFSLFQG